VCSLCECDVNADESTTVSDALTVLQAAVDIPVELACFEAIATSEALVTEAPTTAE
jgi:hypothetical protein